MSKQREESPAGLGRGLKALIGSKRAYPNETDFKIKPAASDKPPSTQIHQLRVDEIIVNPHQPRQSFGEDSLSELTASVKRYGILQPLVVTKTMSGQYELVAGERRLRAAKKLKLTRVPAIIRQAGELEKLELALIENIQRQDLNPIERALAYKKLIDEFGLTQDEAARRLGKSRPAVANSLRLLKLPPEIQKGIASGNLSEGQAKLLLGLKSSDQQLAMYHRLRQRGWTVSETKAAIKQVTVKARRRQRQLYSKSFTAAVNRLTETLKTKVRIKTRGAGGVIEVEFYSPEELAEIIKKITG